MPARTILVVTAVICIALGAGPVNSDAAASSTQAASELDPIVFVHGFGENGGRKFFTSEFRSAGYPSNRLFAFRYDAGNGTTKSNRSVAADLDEYIKEVVLPATGAREVDLVAHSMGSLVVRSCLDFERGCSRRVDDFVSLGGPNHGTWWAAGCWLLYPQDVACREMRPGSQLLRQLNRPPEVPPGVDVTTVRSSGDAQVIPKRSAELDGARNLRITGLSHVELSTSPTVFPLVLEAVT